MKIWWIIGFLLVAAALGGVFYATQQPGFLVGVAGSLIAASVPGLKQLTKIFRKPGPNSAWERWKKARNKGMNK